MIECTSLSLFQASLTDQKRLSSLPEDIFKKIVLLLDQHQGNVLRQLSNEVTNITVGIFRGTLDEARRFPIETVERSKILEQPGSSHELCTLISGTSNSTSLTG